MWVALAIGLVEQCTTSMSSCLHSVRKANRMQPRRTVHDKERNGAEAWRD